MTIAPPAPSRSARELFDLSGRTAIGYHASKGEVIVLTKDLACKWGMHNILSRIPSNRLGNDYDLKGAAVFLASDASNCDRSCPRSGWRPVR